MAAPVTNHIELVLKAQMTAAGSNSRPSFNVFTFRRLTNTNPFVKANVKAAFVTAIAVPIVAAINARWVSYAISIRSLDDALDAYADIAYVATGAIATDSHPTEAAVKMGLQTGLRSRNYLGSKHFTPLSEADTTGDVLTGTGLTNWQAVQAAILAGFTDSDGNQWTPTVVSRTLSQLKTNPTTVDYADVTAVTLNTTIGTMRRRRVRSVVV